jgi:hypothetical protein
VQTVIFLIDVVLHFPVGNSFVKWWGHTDVGPHFSFFLEDVGDSDEEPEPEPEADADDDGESKKQKWASWITGLNVARDQGHNIL